MTIGTIEAMAQSASLEETAYFLALDQIPNMGARTLGLLLEELGSAHALWKAPESFLKQHLTDAKQSQWLEATARLNPLQLWERYRNLDIHLIGYHHPDYPPLLKQIYDPPILLYVRGNPNALVGKTLSFVGTRKASEYGLQVTRKIVTNLKPVGATIVSGLASGIDTQAHKAALRENLPTVAVFGCGIDVVTPTSNQKLAQEIIQSGGALISEYGLGIQPDKHTFPKRNRIIAGLSYATIVVEGNLKSGALITARCATAEGRSVFAVPGNIFNPASLGPLSLIKQGAVPLTVVEDILEELSWLKPQESQNEAQMSLLGTPSTESSDPDEQKVLSCIEYDPTPVERVQQKSGFSSAKVNELITMLELTGLVKMLPGAKVCRQ